MGGTAYSDSAYHARGAARKAAGVPTFAFHSATASAAPSARKAHDTMNPHGVKIRESRDSDMHPESLAIAVMLDVTGSMSRIPTIVQANLPKLMGMLISKGCVAHPQIMIGAVGDARSDRVPMQIGQFESGVEIEDNIINLYLEGGGGGSCEESYELAAYFLARHTSTDCFEKRNKKGYVFIIGDEKPYPQIDPDQVNKIFGDSLQAPIPTSEIIKELQEKYEVYYLMPKGTNHFDEPRVLETWRDLVGQNLLKLEQPEAVCELIAATIGLAEGTLDRVDVAGALSDLGADSSTVASVERALAPVKAGEKRGDELTVAGSGAGSGLATA
jgi:hypothetical protein